MAEGFDANEASKAGGYVGFTWGNERISIPVPPRSEGDTIVVDLRGRKARIMRPGEWNAGGEAA